MLTLPFLGCLLIPDEQVMVQRMSFSHLYLLYYIVVDRKLDMEIEDPGSGSSSGTNSLYEFDLDLGQVISPLYASVFTSVKWKNVRCLLGTLLNHPFIQIVLSTCVQIRCYLLERDKVQMQALLAWSSG